jgi:hypothetical protein
MEFEPRIYQCSMGETKADAWLSNFSAPMQKKAQKCMLVVRGGTHQSPK